MIIPVGLVVLLIVVIGVMQFGGNVPKSKLALDIERESQEVQGAMDKADGSASEPTLDEIDSAVSEAAGVTPTPTPQSKPGATPSKPVSAAVSASSILSEQKTVEFGSEVNDFVAGELETKEFNAALSEF